MKQIDDKIKKEKLNPNMAQYLKNKEDIINYLLEPIIDNDKDNDLKEDKPKDKSKKTKRNNNDIGFIFNTFPYKIRLRPELDESETFKTIVEIYYNNELEFTIKNDNQIFYLENNNQIHIFIDSKNKFNLQIYDENNVKLITQYVGNNELKGVFGEEINLFLRTNNTSMFKNFNILEKIDSLTYPYNPFIDFYKINN